MDHVNICKLSLTNDMADNNHVFTSAKYSESFFTQLRRLFDQKKYTDVILICSEKPASNEPDPISKTIACHKLVLSCLSSYFDSMFSSNFDETKTNKIYMPHSDYDTLNNIINYAYTGEIELNVNNVQNVFCLANLFQIENIMNLCSEFMEQKLDISNCLDVFKFSKQYHFEYLQTKSSEFLFKNFADLIKQDEFLEFSDVDLLNEILSSDLLDIPNEDILLSALLKWSKHKSDRDLDFKNIFLNSIRLSLVDSDYLKNIVSENKSLFNSNEDFLVNKIRLEDKKRSGMAKAEQCFLIIGGNCDLADGTYVNCFNPFNGEKYYLSKSYAEKSAFSDRGYFHIENPGVCVTNENRIFVAGGVLVFHQFKTSRKQKPNTSSSRYDEFRSIFPDPESLADGDETLSKELFEYDIKNENWIKRSNMLFAKANFSLCALNNNKLYSFGGISIGQIPLDVVESYDIMENQWTYVGTMPNAFVAGCVVEYENNFYVLGGRNGVGRHDTCFIFKPDLNEWTEIASLKIGRFNFGACVLNDKIYTFGGQRYAESREHYFTREALDSVEVYDIKLNEWSEGPKMPAPFYNTGVCVYSEKKDSIYICGTTECQFSGTTLFGFMFTSVFRLDFLTDINNELRTKWTIVEHDVSDIKAYYRCVSAKVNTRKLHKFSTDIELRE